MTNRFRRPVRALLSCAVIFIGFLSSPAGAAPEEKTIVGRLTDEGGAAIAGATVLVLPVADSSPSDPCQSEPGWVAAYRSGSIEGGLDQLRTDAHGLFSVQLPPGRYVVASMKRGYDISMTEVNTLSSRALRLRMQLTGRVAAPEPGQLEPGWLIGQERADVLRDEGSALPAAVFLEAPPQGGSDGTTSSRRDLARDILSTIDGDVTQIFGAQSLLGLADQTSAGDTGARATALMLTAPLSPVLQWSVEGSSVRTRTDLNDQDGSITGGSDHLSVGVGYGSHHGRPMTGALRAGFGGATSGASQFSQRVMEGSGEIAVADSAMRRLEVGVRAWNGRADLRDGGFVTLDAPAGADTAPGKMEDAGLDLYAGERLDVGTATRVDYGVEYRSDTLLQVARLVPRVGLTQTLSIRGQNDLAIRSELLLDTGSPGGRVAVEATPIERLRLSAALSILPANAILYAEPSRSTEPVVLGLRSPGQTSADTRTLDLAMASEFGALQGSLSGSVGTTGRRALPTVEEGPLPVVSFGSERFYETRLGLAYRPWETRMEVGYRRVESDAEPQGAAGAPSHDYRRLDLLVSQALPSPRSLMGARLRALLEWQGINYQSLSVADGGAFPLSGLTSRLSGGVGLSF